MGPVFVVVGVRAVVDVIEQPVVGAVERVSRSLLRVGSWLILVLLDLWLVGYRLGLSVIFLGRQNLPGQTRMIFLGLLLVVVVVVAAVSQRCRLSGLDY